MTRSTTDRKPEQSPRTVLLIDSDASLVELIRKALEGAGFIVHVAAEGVRLGELVNTLFPDLAIIGCILADMDGFTAVETLRKEPFGKALPMIMLAASQDQANLHRAYELGIDSFQSTAPTARGVLSRELLAKIRCIFTLPSAECGLEPTETYCL
jgi:CheY-like chemotaxis protein